MKNFFKSSFEHNEHANQVYIDAILKLPIETAHDKIITIMSHLLLAHTIWIERVNPDFDSNKVYLPWDELQLVEFTKLNKENHLKTIALIHSKSFCPEASLTIKYKNSKGFEFKNEITDIYYHILTHSAYHRGQLALLFRNNNIDPPVTDYIFYKR